MNIKYNQIKVKHAKLHKTKNNNIQRHNIYKLLHFNILERS